MFLIDFLCWSHKATRVRRIDLFSIVIPSYQFAHLIVPYSFFIVCMIVGYSGTVWLLFWISGISSRQIHFYIVYLCTDLTFPWLSHTIWALLSPLGNPLLWICCHKCSCCSSVSCTWFSSWNIVFATGLLRPQVCCQSALSCWAISNFMLIIQKYLRNKPNLKYILITLEIMS